MRAPCPSERQDTRGLLQKIFVFLRLNINLVVWDECIVLRNVMLCDAHYMISICILYPSPCPVSYLT